MSSYGEVADFTTGNSNPIMCQRCLQSFEDGTELYFMQDRKADWGGKKICAGCRQYYLRKTETRKTQLASSLSPSSTIVLSNNKSIIPGRASASVQITPVAQPAVSRQDIQKAIAEAQRRGIKSTICRNTSDLITLSYRSKSPRPYGSTTWFDGTTTRSKFPEASRHPQIHHKPKYMAESLWLQTH
jgi:hypothetical protein